MPYNLPHDLREPDGNDPNARLILESLYRLLPLARGLCRVCPCTNVCDRCTDADGLLFNAGVFEAMLDGNVTAFDWDRDEARKASRQVRTDLDETSLHHALVEELWTLLDYCNALLAAHGDACGCYFCDDVSGQLYNMTAAEQLLSGYAKPWPAYFRRQQAQFQAEGELEYAHVFQLLAEREETKEPQQPEADTPVLVAAEGGCP